MLTSTGASRDIRGGDDKMTNHPNRSRTYWYISGRGFANEYSIGIATDFANREWYKDQGYQRIDRAKALREMCNRGDAATRIYCGVTINGEEDMGRDRFQIAHDIRVGR